MTSDHRGTPGCRPSTSGVRPPRAPTVACVLVGESSPRSATPASSSVLRELIAFALVGGGAFLLDLGVFQLLYAGLGAGAVTAKLVSTLVSMTVAYLGHRRFAFAHRANVGMRREYLVFALVNGFTLALSLGVVAFVRYELGHESSIVLQLANVGSIVVGTVIRFLAYRRWVFSAPAGAAADR